LARGDWRPDPSVYVWLRPLLSEKRDRVDTGEHCNPLDRSKGQVSLAAFYTAQVGPVIAELIGELFLAHSLALAQAAEVASEDLLQFTFHLTERRGTILEGLHTYE